MLLLGNLAAFVGCVMMVAIGFIKKKERVIIAVQLLMGFYDWYYLNYVAFTADILTMLSNFIGILMFRKAK